MSEPNEDVDNLIVRTREAHEVLKDLRILLREIREAITDADEARMKLIGAIAYTAQAEVDERIESAISTGLEGYADAIEEAIKDAEEHVYQRFENLQHWLADQLQERKPGESRTWLRNQDLPDLLRSDRTNKGNK